MAEHLDRWCVTHGARWRTVGELKYRPEAKCLKVLVGVADARECVLESRK